MKTKTNQLIKRMRNLEINHDPDGWPAVQMKDITKLCDIIEGIIPALDLLEIRLERGEVLAKQDGCWWLFDAEGEGVVSGETLRNLLVNLIFMDC